MLRWCLPTVRSAGRRVSPSVSRTSIRTNARVCSSKVANDIEESGNCAEDSVTHPGEASQSHNGAATVKEDREPQAPSSRPVLSIRNFPSSDDSGVSQMTPGSRPPSPIVLLKQFLSRDNLNSATPTILPFHIIRSSYRSLQRRNLLHLLTWQESNQLISLLGALSLVYHQKVSRDAEGIHKALAEVPPIYLNAGIRRLLPMMDQYSFWSHWSWVVELAGVKKRTDEGLSISDSFWLMMGSLAEADALRTEPITPENILKRDNAIRRAKRSYIHLHGSAPLNVFLGYARMALAAGHVDDVAELLAKWLSKLNDIPDVLREMLWVVTLSPEKPPSSKVKEDLLNALKSRLDDRFPVTTNEDDSLDIDIAVAEERAMRPADLADLFTQCLFSSSPNIPPTLRNWLGTTLRSLLDPNPILERSFKHLAILAMINAPPELVAAYRSALSRENKPAMRLDADWHAISTLTILERMTGSDQLVRNVTPFADDIASGVKKVISSLWVPWSRSDTYRPPAVSITVLSSIISFAGRCRDRQLVLECYGYAISHGLTVLPIFTAYLVAALSSGSDIREILVELAQYMSHSSIQSVVNEGVEHVASWDARFAAHVRNVAGRSSILISGDTIHAIGMAFVREGDYDFALSSITEERLSSTQRVNILESIASAVAQNGPYILSRDVASKFLVNMHRVFRFVPPTSKARKDIERALYSLAKLEHEAGVVSVIASIHSNTPEYFPAEFYESFLQMLLARRQFRLACILFSTVQATYPTRASAWYDLLIKELASAGARVLLTKMDRKFRHISGMRSISRVYSAVYAYSHPKPRARLLRVQSQLASGELPKSRTHIILRMLLKAGRVRVAKKMYSQLRDKHNRETRTVMGNDILNASMRGRNRRNAVEVRRVLSEMKQLARDGSFVADRVTFNILIKAILRWRKKMDAFAVRALFDRVILSGYPAGGHLPPGQPVFGAAGDEMVDGIVLPEMSGEIDFRRHVAPLYKMFAKALFLRKDAVGARKVVGIIKSLQAVEANQARRSNEARDGDET
ncbi:hypothetical protein K474DRAFT_1770754 [Panus rudis PR-1116 ss-1]|nr:hypothetical protein K474DRAFT_1770754 [Panus rudis PR-1116 ss-1]